MSSRVRSRSGLPAVLVVLLAALLSAATACSEGNGVEPAGRVVALPAPSTRGTVSVEQALADRRSLRAFTSQRLTRRQVAQLLWAGQGENRPGRRTAPSAGARYPVTLYALARALTLPGGEEPRYLVPVGHPAR
ncbi:MAG TPA: nitroreductase family protein [Marmoricola sp.]|nr:nitroreductase family protein [Marmoricola sp.]